jgi:hypothetical protein
MYLEREAEDLREFRENPEECRDEARGYCWLEAAHPEVRASQE